MIDNFIHVNEKSMTFEQCQQLIDFFENNPERHLKGTIVGDSSEDTSQYKKCTEMTIESEQLFTYDLFKNLSSTLHQSVEQYVFKYPFLELIERWFIAPTFKIQKYLPNEAYYLLHSENVGYSDGVYDKRLIAWMVYLNDVTDGGETEFPTQEVKFQPKQGNMLFWPAYWTHPHRGLPSPTQVKYILTGWFSFL